MCIDTGGNDGDKYRSNDRHEVNVSKYCEFGKCWWKCKKEEEDGRGNTPIAND